MNLIICMKGGYEEFHALRPGKNKAKLYSTAEKAGFTEQRRTQYKHYLSAISALSAVNLKKQSQFGGGEKEHKLNHNKEL